MNIDENRDLSIKIDDRPRLSYPIESRHPVTLYGDLTRDAQLFRKELAKLPYDDGGMHGRLQVMRGAAKRALQACERLIADIEEGRRG
jgi:hypothetical protein